MSTQAQRRMSYCCRALTGPTVRMMLVHHSMVLGESLLLLYCEISYNRRMMQMILSTLPCIEGYDIVVPSRCPANIFSIAVSGQSI